jgi:hypothetical protein
MKDLTDLELQLMDIDERLRPTATRPIAFDDVKTIALLAEARSPLDETGVRSETEALLKALAAEYENSDEETRKAIRCLFACYPHFSWAASFAISPITEAGFRQDLILFSMLDQGKDSRDALLALRALCEQARSSGIDVKPILREVAEFSSDENKYGMGSTKRMLDEA